MKYKGSCTFPKKLIIKSCIYLFWWWWSRGISFRIWHYKRNLAAIRREQRGNNRFLQIYAKYFLPVIIMVSYASLAGSGLLVRYSLSHQHAKKSILNESKTRWYSLKSWKNYFCKKLSIGRVSFGFSNFFKSYVSKSLIKGFNEVIFRSRLLNHRLIKDL